ncbi:MAG: glycosyltransferase family 39 protein [Cyanobacteria bacterium P01_D01_bin.105]
MARFLNLSADFPIGLASSGAAYTDEGWWSRNAVAIIREGHWYIDDGYNTILNLPTVPLLQTLWFTVFGISQFSARALTAVCSIIISGLVYAIARRELSASVAWIAPFIILSNYPVFVFSRIALLEMPMLVLVLLSLWIATLPRLQRKVTIQAKRAWRSHFTSALILVTSALLAVLATLAKITALFAAPMVLVMLALQPGTWHSKARHSLIWLLTFVIAYGLYHAFVTPETAPTTTTESYDYFARYNVTRKLHDSLLSVIKGPLRVLKYCFEVFPLLFPALALSISTLIKVKPYRTSYVFRIVFLWSILFLAGLSISNYAAPRYFIVLIVPIALVIPMMFNHFWQQRNLTKQPTINAKLKLKKPELKKLKLKKTVFLGCVYLSVILSLFRISHYLLNPQYSFVQMAQQVEATIAANHNHSPILLGHFADSIALSTNVRAVNDKLGYQPLSYRIETFKPGYYISIGEIKPPISQAIAPHYTMRLLQQFDVYQNHDFGKPVLFYQLTPKK